MMPVPFRWMLVIAAGLAGGCAENAALPPGRAASQATAAATVNQAQRVVTLITTVRRDNPGFLTDHGTLRSDLDNLELRATRVVQDDGFLADNRKRFIAALDQAISRADQAAQRPGDTETAHAQAREVREQLKAVRGS